MSADDADRVRLLAHGEMCSPIYSARPAAEVAADTYPGMVAAAAALGLGLTEPVFEAGPADWTGGRIIRTRAGVYDTAAY